MVLKRERHTLGHDRIKMIRDPKIHHQKLNELINAIFESGSPVVKEAYSAHDTPTRTFSSADELLQDLAYSPGQKSTFFQYTIYYPSALGLVLEERIQLKPEKCGGHTFRFSQQGWGLIQLQCDFKFFPEVQCHIGVNSKERAEKWFSTYSNMGNPNLWNWEVLKSISSKLQRKLKKLAQQTSAGDVATRAAPDK